MDYSHEGAARLMTAAGSRSTRKRPRPFRGVVALLSSAAFVVACSGTPSTTTSPAGSAAPGSSSATTPSGGPAALATLNFGYSLEPATLDPYMGPGIAEFNFNVNIGDGLYTTNQKLEPIPNLADSSSQIDPLTWEFKLHQGVKFSNGEPFDAQSVVASYEHSMSSTLPIKNTWGADINLDTIEVVDPYTVRFHLKEPTPFLLARIANDHYMQPPKWLSTASEETLAREPIGTGPYVLKEWVAGDHITLEANPDYWGSPKPAIKTVVFKFLPDESTRVANLRTGAVDIINYLSPASVPLVTQNADIEVKTVESGRRVYAGLNTKLAPTDNLKVRQAINYGTNVEQITQTIFAGATSRLTNFSEPAFRDPAVTGYSYDPDKARQLLTEAGFPNGIDVTWDIDNRSYLGSDQFPEAVAASLAEVGIRVTLNKIDKSIMTTNQKNRTTNQMYIRSNAAYYDPGTTFSILEPRAAGNATSWADPTFVDLQTKMLTGGTPEERLAWSHQAQAIVMDQAPMLFLWREPGLYAVNKRVTGFEAPADEHIRLSLLGG
jgi:peptide/nickel transport system substrate-binding protein